MNNMNQNMGMQQGVQGMNQNMGMQQGMGIPGMQPGMQPGVQGMNQNMGMQQGVQGMNPNMGMQQGMPQNPNIGMQQNPGMGMNPNMGMGMPGMSNMGQGMNPNMGMQQNPGMGMQQGMQGMQQGMQQNQQYEQKAKTTIEVARSNYTTIGLFEYAGAYDPAEKFPKAFCFVMGVPGLKDEKKQSGRTYNQDAKITMKFSTKELRSLGHALINIAIFKQAADPFEKHSDPSKNSYSQNNGDQNTKKLKASFDAARKNIAITMNFGQKNVLIPVPLQDALGLGEDLINLGNYTDAKLFDYKFAHKIGREEITGIDYDPAGTEEPTVNMGVQDVQQGVQGMNQNMGIQQQNPGMGMQQNVGMNMGMPGQPSMNGNYNQYQQGMPGQQ